MRIAALVLLACACSGPVDPVWTSGTVAVSSELETGPVEVAAEFWNGHGATWTVARTCTKGDGHCVAVTRGTCAGDHTLACARWDDALWRIKVTDQGLLCMADCDIDPALAFAHELGHVMGFEHRDRGVMTARLEDATWE